MITEIERKLNLVRESIKELSFEIRHLEERQTFRFDQEVASRLDDLNQQIRQQRRLENEYLDEYDQVFRQMSKQGINPV